LKGNGDGTFQSTENYGVEWGPGSIFADDFDDDGDNDLAVTCSNVGKVSVLINLDNPTEINNEVINVPGIFSLRSYPNPFNASTTIRYGLPEQSDVRIEIYNILGQRVVTLFDGNRQAGYHTVTWRADHYPSGVYFSRLQAGGRSENIKTVLLK
jgi:hypothetical protein